MITKVLFGVAIALSAAVATADSAIADPSPYSVLSCSCDSDITLQPRGAPNEQIDAGIQHGLSDLLGAAG